MRKELKRPSGDVFAILTYEKESNLIFLDWRGFLQVNMVKEGSEELLKMIKTYKCSEVLVSNRNVSGPWSDTTYLEWAKNDWNPRASQAGLRHMAVIVSENIFAQLSLQGFEKVTAGGYTTRSFGSEQTARDWMKEVQKVTVK